MWKIERTCIGILEDSVKSRNNNNNNKKIKGMKRLYISTHKNGNFNVNAYSTHNNVYIIIIYKKNSRERYNDVPAKINWSPCCLNTPFFLSRGRGTRGGERDRSQRHTR